MPNRSILPILLLCTVFVCDPAWPQLVEEPPQSGVPTTIANPKTLSNDALIKLVLEENNSKVQLSAIEELKRRVRADGLSNFSKLAKLLTNVLSKASTATNVDPAVRVAAIAAICDVGECGMGPTPSIFAKLALHETDDSVRGAALQLLQPGSDGSVLRRVALGDKSPAVRLAAVAILSPWPWHRDILKQIALRDTDLLVRIEAVRKLNDESTLKTVLLATIQEAREQGWVLVLQNLEQTRKSAEFKNSRLAFLGSNQDPIVELAGIYIRKGHAALLPFLLHLFESYTNLASSSSVKESMARLYINSGRHELTEVAEKWAIYSGYFLKPGGLGQPVRWGQ